MKAVLDTSALIYLNDFRVFNEMFTVSDVVDEVKDKTSASKLSAINLQIVNPTESFIEKIKKTAKQTGDIDKLSKTDIKVLALACELGASIVSDDYSVQNVAKKLGIKFFSVFNPKITKEVKWEMYCPSCRKFHANNRICPVCGSTLIRKRVNEELIRNETQ